MGAVPDLLDARRPAERPSVEQRVWWFCGVDCVLAVALRLGLAWWTGGYPTDVLTFQSWAATLRDQPLGRFYATAQSPDHLPGDLWFLKATVSVFDALGGQDVHGRVFALLTQGIPTVGDLLVALMLVLVVRRLTDPETAGRTARWYLLNPATIFLTGIWGQWDSVSLGLLLTGVWLMRGGRWWVLSAPFLAWAVLVKPQLVLPALCFVVLLVHHLLSRRTTSLTRLAGGAVAWVALGVGTAYALLAPFDVHLLRAPAGGSTLAERVHTALGLYPFTTLGAANLWMLPLGSLRRVRDDVPGWLGATPQQWGAGLLALALAYVVLTVVARLRRADGVVAAAWAATAVAFAVFLLPTRVHERYVLPVLGLALLLAALRGFDRRLTVCFWLVSACLTVNLVLVLYGGIQGPGGQTFSFGRPWWIGLTLVYGAVAAVLLVWPWLAAPSADPADSRRTPGRG
jgi:hypothetical protein